MVKTEDHFVGATWDSGDQMPRFIAEEIRRFKALHRGEGRGLRLGGVMRGQSVALLGIEYGVALHVGDFPLAYSRYGLSNTASPF
jgi:hypothetical protein